MSRDILSKMLRAQAWERAKAELASIPAVDYPPEKGRPDDYYKWAQKCAKRRRLIDNFIKSIEDEELW